MARRALAGLIVVGLGIGIWLLWQSGDQAGLPSTTVLAVGTSTTTPVEAEPTTSVATTATTLEESHVVETVEEAEAILRELWFGWFEGIYNQDEDRIREVVATEEFVAAGVAAFDSLEFQGPPAASGIVYDGTEILFADNQCLVVWTTGTASFLTGESQNTAVEVLRSVKGSWRMLSTWQYKEDLWEDDCKSRL